VDTLTERPGGKAVNVARLLHQLGEPTRLVAPVGGETGEQLRHGLEAAGLGCVLVPSGPATRRTVTVVERDAHGATTLVEPAALDCWPALLNAVEDALAGSDVLVIAGSVPRGVPDDGLAELVSAGRRHGLPVLVDTQGPWLLSALAAGASVVKPNVHELEAVTGDDDPLRAARTLVRSSAATVVASLGERGVVAVTTQGVWEARPEAVLTGNPTGAGDALVAGLARGLLRDPEAARHPDRMLHDAVALSAAAVLSPVAGDVDPAHHAAQLDGVVVRALDAQR
jgi:tagatose 6-phosphate kinase